MASLTTNLNLQVQAVATGTQGPFGNTPTDPILVNIAKSLATGTGLNSANLYYAPAAYTITAGANQDIDLSSAATNGIGVAVAFTKIRMILIQNTTTTAGFTINVGGAPANPFISWLMASGDGVVVGPDGILLLYNPSLAGYACTGGASDTLRINNPNASSVVVNALFVGE